MHEAVSRQRHLFRCGMTHRLDLSFDQVQPLDGLSQNHVDAFVLLLAYRGRIDFCQLVHPVVQLIEEPIQAVARLADSRRLARGDAGAG